MRSSTGCGPVLPVFALLFCLFAPIAPAVGLRPAVGHRPADAEVEPRLEGKAQVSFSEGFVRATGYGALPANAASPDQARLAARSAARGDAVRTLSAAVATIQVTAVAQVKNLMSNGRVSARIAALLNAPRLVDEGFGRNGTAYVTVELPLYGPDSIASAVLPEIAPASRKSAGGALGFAPSVSASAPSASSSFRRGSALRLTPLSESGPFTSVIIDCRGLNIEPILSPGVYDTTGREVYSVARIASENALEAGVVGYMRSPGEAERSGRAGSRPLIVRAVRVADKNRFHPVISLEDADRVLAANNRDRFLERTAVLLLIDPAK